MRSDQDQNREMEERVWVWGNLGRRHSMCSIVYFSAQPALLHIVLLYFIYLLFRIRVLKWKLKNSFYASLPILILNVLQLQCQSSGIYFLNNLKINPSFVIVLIE